MQVQDDLMQLKEKIAANSELRNLDLSALENAISKTQDGLKVWNVKDLTKYYDDQICRKLSNAICRPGLCSLDCLEGAHASLKILFLKVLRWGDMWNKNLGCWHR